MITHQRGEGRASFLMHADPSSTLCLEPSKLGGEQGLGNLRVRPALVTLGSLLIFCALCYMLHERDKVATARVADFEAGKA